MKLMPNNWLYNAGLVGLLRILQSKGLRVDSRISDEGFDIWAEDLEGFADAYCKYVLQTSLERFVYWPDQTARELLNSFGLNYVDLRTNCLERLNRKLQSTTNVGKAEQAVKDVINTCIAELEQAIQRNFEEGRAQLFQSKPKNKADQKAFEKKLKELGKNCERAKKVAQKIGSVESLEAQKYIVNALKRFYFNKDVIGNYSLARGHSRVSQFEQKYVVPARKLLKGPDFQGKINCKFCGRPSVDLSNERFQDVVFNEGMFSISSVSLAFENFFYNLIPDLFICDMCELVLLCAWAGFNQIPWRLRSGNEDTEYLFINLPSLPLLFEQNNKVRAAYQRAQMPLQDTIYEDVMADLFSEERRRRGQWALQNILFVEIRTVPSKQSDKPTFKYFHVGKDVAELFTKSETRRSFQRISGRLAAPGDKGGILSLQLKREMVKRLLSGDQIYDLTYQVCRQGLNSQAVQPKNILEVVFLHSLRQQIWRKYKTNNGTNLEQTSQRGGIMEPRQVYGILRGFYQTGASLGKSMQLEKRQRLAYRLMSVVRSGKYAEFYDMLMKLYVDAQRPIPTDLLSLLNPNDTIEFESKAYALLSGFLGESQPAVVAEATMIGSTQEASQKIPSEEGGNNG
jgi:CRISPR-associated protein Cas8b1/Cst1 subtype I-B